MRTRRDVITFSLALVFTLLALIALAPTRALAETRYTVRVFGGNRGSVNGTEEYYVLPDTFAYDDVVNLNDYIDASDGYKGIAITDEKYYVKGYRVSGEDELAKSSFIITEDTDFVVAYGVRGDVVSYTISFVEYGTGNALANDEGATSVTFYGNKGDKPVVPYEYVPGYRPRYRNISGTLGDEGTNNWTLEYIPLEQPVVEEVVTTTTTTTGTTTGTTTTGTATTEATAGAAATGEAATGEAAAGTEGQTTATETGTTVVEPPATEEILDLDTPLAGPDSQAQGDGSSQAGKETTGALSSIATKLVIAIIVLAIALAAFYMLRRRAEDRGDGKDLLD